MIAMTSMRRGFGDIRWRRTIVALIIVQGLVCFVAACGSEAPTSRKFEALSGADLIAATRAEGTLAFSLREEGDVADSGTDHGISGGETEEFALEGSFDLVRNRALLNWTVPDDSEPTPVHVELRTIDGASYVRDGSWLCPLCGLDDSDQPPLPRDKWIILEPVEGDVAFHLTGSSLHGQLGWLTMIDAKMLPGDVSRLADGTPVAQYRADVAVADVNAALQPADPRGEVAAEFQGETISISVQADERGRVRELVARYRVDDRVRSLTVTIRSFGDRVAIEMPPTSELYDIDE